MRLKYVQQLCRCLWQQFLCVAALCNRFPLCRIQERHVPQPCIGNVLEYEPVYVEEPLPAVALCPDIAALCVV